MMKLMDRRNAELAEQVGLLRNRERKTERLKADKALSLTKDIEGAVAECAVALATGLEWYAFEKDRQGVNVHGDVGPLEIKSVTQPWHKLIIHYCVDIYAPYVLVVVQQASKGWYTQVVGWCFGFETFHNSSCWDTALPVPAYSRKRDRLYSTHSLSSWLMQSGHFCKPVRKPKFAQGFAL